MSQYNLIYSDPYRPTVLKVNSLGIGISDSTLESLALTETEFLIVGERATRVSTDKIIKTYGLIVDHQGIGVNTTLKDRVEAKNNFAVTIDGNIFVSGAVIACNIVNVGTGAAGNNFWNLAQDEDYNIYYTGNITLGNNVSARENMHKINIVESADRNIDHSQFSIQNNNLSQLRMGIVGSCNTSPVVFNTPIGVPMEFHIGRNQSYFASTYNGMEQPRYIGAQDAPNMCIDASGNVGIRTNYTPQLAYRQRKISDTGEVVFPDVSQKADFAVNGTAFLSNLLIWDYESNKAENIDMLYIRQRGVTLDANQIKPGDFSVGQFRFRSNVVVQKLLTVQGDHRVTGIIYSDNEIMGNFITTRNLEVTTGASFCNDTYFNNDVIVREGLRIRGGIFTEVIDGDNVYWCNVQFQVAKNDVTNINNIGQGISTPGRMGVGIDPRNDSVNNQLVVTKRAADIFEVELFDKSNPRLFKSMYIGHPNVVSELTYDASIVFTTPNQYDPIFNRARTRPLLQNMYFYPGSYDTTQPFILRVSSPPVLNVNVNKCVGINKFNPLHTLDVNGDINLSGDLFKDSIKIGLWYESDFPNILGGTYAATFKGLRYSNPNCSNIGINVPPDPRYALNIIGGVKSTAFYTDNNDLIVPWLSSEEASSPARIMGQQAKGTFTLNNVGIGVDKPSTCLELKNYNRPTVIRLYKPDSPRAAYNSSYIDFSDIGRQWVIGVDHNTDTFHIASSSNVLMSSENKRALWINRVFKNNQTGHQVVINGSGTATRLYNSQGSSNPDPNAALIVDGDMAVMGDVRISGRYIVNGQPLINSNVDNNTIPLATNDVYIAGSRIFLNPTNVLAIGYDADRVLQETTDNTLFRVYQPNPSIDVIGRFTCTGDRGFIEITNTRGDAARIGFSQESVFSIMNKNNEPFLSLVYDDNRESFVGFNNGREVPTANLHVFTNKTGDNMLRLTRILSGSDISDAAPEMELEKRIYNIISTVPDKIGWRIHGPDGSYNQKLSFRYRNNDDIAEKFCFTANGCIGIGNTRPDYAIDIKTSDQKGSIRLLNTSYNAFPQLIFQSGADIYGGDTYKDFRFYSFSNTFGLDTLDFQNTTPRKLIHVASNNSMGLLTDADEAYNLTVYGSLNVKDALYVNGYPILIGGSNLSELFPIRATNILLSPVQEENGGVSVNMKYPSSNLFHIFTYNSANAFILDSVLNECQMHFRCESGDRSGKYNMYRMSQCNQTFQLTHYPNCSTEKYIPDTHNGYCNVVTWQPSPRIHNDYDLTLYGSIEMKSSAPQIKLASSTISFSNEDLRVMTSNNIGIGTLFPEGKLHLVADKDTACIIHQNSTTPIVSLFNPSSEILRVENNGYVGIGTNIPSVRLDVMGDVKCYNIAPQQHAAYDIGTQSSRFRDLYTSSSININNVQMNDKYDGLYVTTAGTKLSKVACESVQLGSEEYSTKQLHMFQDAPVLFAESNLITQGRVDYIPLLRSSASGCFGWNTTSSEGLFHLVNRDSNATLILDHVNRAGSNILLLRNNGSNVVTVNKAGNVGIGTLLPTSTLHIVSSNVVSAFTVQQRRGSAYVSQFISTANSVVIDGRGNVGIGITTPQAALHVNGQSIYTQNVYMAQNLEVQGNTITHGDQTTDSDIRLKYGLERISDALDKVCSLTGYTFNKHGSTERSTGLVAQDVEKILPECVKTHPDTDIRSVAYGNMMGLIVEAIKEIKTELDMLKAAR